MPQTIIFDGDGLFQALVEDLVSFMDVLIEDFHKEATASMKASDHGVDKAEYDAAKNYITAQCWFHANSIMESFGTGLNLDTGSKYLKDYMGSKFWNELRTGPQIVGRKPGSYTNIFGEEVESSGMYEGKNRPGPNRKGTFAIQHAEDFWIQNGETRADTRIKEHINDFIAKNASLYFKEVNV